MVHWKKMMVVAGMVVGLGLTANLVQAGCGQCGGDAGHTHDAAKEKVACAKCAHNKACTTENCSCPGKDAACVCAKKASCVKCDHAKACSAEGCEDAAHAAACICPA